MIKRIFFFFIMLFLTSFGCDYFQKSPEPWKPVMEETTFTYLHSAVASAIDKTQNAANNIQAGQDGKAKDNLQQVLQTLLELKHYYIPMTEIRQLIYDADRLYYLKQPGQVKNKLEAAKAKLLAIGDADGVEIKQSVDEVILMIDDLQLSIHQGLASAADKFLKLGAKVNLMALKGELIIGNGRFRGEF